MTTLHYEFKVGISTMSVILKEIAQAFFDILSPKFTAAPSEEDL